MALRSLRSRSILMVTALYALVGSLTLGAFFLVAERLVEAFGRRFAEQHAVLDKHRILAPIHREVVLARKLADAPILKDWLRREQDPALRRMALAELDSHRRFFSAGSYFVMHEASRKYYVNNAPGEFTGRELRYKVDPRDPTMAWYGTTLREVDDFALHVDRSEQLGLVKVWINVVVKDEGRKVGLGGTGLDLTTFLKDLSQRAQTILVDGRGNLQAHPDTALMEAIAREKDEARRPTLGQLLDRDLDREELKARLATLEQHPDRVETFHLSLQGRRHLVAATAIPDIGWVALVLVDPSQVMSLAAFRPIALILVLSLLVTIILVTVLLNRLVLQPLGLLTTSAKAIAAGNYQLALPSTREDEIGDLTRAFDQMTREVREATATLESKVRDRTAELTEAHGRLLDSNRKVMDSLQVAQLLQRSLLPEPAQLRAQLPDHFVLYRPRDLVGGDFYALFPDPQGCLVAMADCTGHGVPGAPMTMSARSLLDQLLAELGPEDPAALLRAMNRALRTTLNHGEEGPDNGLELGLLRLNRTQGQLRFASAHIPLLLVHGYGTWEELVGDRESLGYRRSAPDHTFRTLERPLRPGTAYYLFTDGILDQAGGPRGFGLGRSRLRATLEALGNRPMADQGRALARTLAAYQGERPQRDDITLLGFRLEPPDEADPK